MVLGLSAQNGIVKSFIHVFTIEETSSERAVSMDQERRDRNCRDKAPGMTRNNYETRSNFVGNRTVYVRWRGLALAAYAPTHKRRMVRGSTAIDRD